jgi:hypothetical protein
MPYVEAVNDLRTLLNDRVAIWRGGEQSPDNLRCTMTNADSITCALANFVYL